MKCINIKSFILIIFIFTILIIVISYIIFTYIHILEKKNETKKILENEKIEQLEKENLAITENKENKEKDYIQFLKEKYASKKILALTFDDGPSKYTYDLIDELNKRNINVTFFVLGQNIEKYPDSLEFAFKSGNEIEIHSYNHKLFTKLTR